MSALLLPSDSFVIAPTGATLGQNVSGSEQLLVVREDGTPTFVAITEISGSREIAAWRLLTGIGDILLPDGARTFTREGLLTGARIAERAHRGAPIRMEVLSPVDLPIKGLPRAPKRETVHACLGAFSRRVIRIPRELADSDDIAGGVESLLRSTNVRYRLVDHQRWVVLTFDGVDGGPVAGIVHPDEANWLLTLTAWEEGDPPISRTALADGALRRQLLAALASARRPFEVHWGPSYFPVEARVRTLDLTERRSFAPVNAAFRETAPVREVRMASAGPLVVGLGIVGPSGP